jgi:hypothetical protein
VVILQDLRTRGYGPYHRSVGLFIGGMWVMSYLQMSGDASRIHLFSYSLLRTSHYHALYVRTVVPSTFPFIYPFQVSPPFVRTALRLPRLIWTFLIAATSYPVHTAPGYVVTGCAVLCIYTSCDGLLQPILIYIELRLSCLLSF